MGTKEQMKEERDKIVNGLEEAYKNLVRWKRQNNSPLIVVRDGKITAVQPQNMRTAIKYKR